LSTCVERRALLWSATVLPVALVSSDQLRNAIRLNIVRFRAVHLASDRIAQFALRVVSVALAIRIVCACNVPTLYSLLALLFIFIAIETLVASVLILTLCALLDAPAVDALSVIADAVHITLLSLLTLLTDGNSKLASIANACLVSTALEALISIASLTYSKAVALILDTLLIADAVLVLGAAIIEASLNDALLFVILTDTSDKASTIISSNAFTIILTLTIPCIFTALSSEAMKRERAAL